MAAILGDRRALLVLYSCLMLCHLKEHSRCTAMKDKDRSVGLSDWDVGADSGRTYSNLGVFEKKKM